MSNLVDYAKDELKRIGRILYLVPHYIQTQKNAMMHCVV